MKRRDAIVALLALGAAPNGGLAQRRTTIGAITPGSAAEARRNFDGLIAGLREFGHVQGRTFSLEERIYGGEVKTLSPLIRDLLAKKPDVLVVGGLTVVQAAKQEAKSTPIVVANASDLLASGVVRSYARPDGNVTGLTTLTDVMMVKRLELLVEAAPQARKIMHLINPAHALAKSIEAQTRKAAEKLGVELFPVYAGDERQLEAAIDKIGEMRPHAVLISPHALFARHSTVVIERAMKHRAFVVHWQPYGADLGALLVQGIDSARQFRRAASYVDRILKGARPGDLPIEQVTSDELVVNLKTAKALGIKVSQPVLIRANRVIQ